MLILPPHVLGRKGEGWEREGEEEGRGGGGRGEKGGREERGQKGKGVGGEEKREERREESKHIKVSILPELSSALTNKEFLLSC